MKKILIIAAAVLCIMFVSCDADSINKTGNGLKQMSSINLAADSVKEDSLKFIKDSAIPGIKQDIEVTDDIKKPITISTIPGTTPEEEAELLRAYFYITALAVNDVDQKEQGGKMREYLATTLCQNSLNQEPEYTFTAILNDLIYQIDHAQEDTTIQQVKDFMEFMGVEQSVINQITNTPVKLARIRKIVAALKPAAAGFDAVKARIYDTSKDTCTYADYMTYWMSVMMTKEIAAFIANGDTSLVSILDSTECDRILAYIHAIEVINNVDFDFPAIVSGLTS